MQSDVAALTRFSGFLSIAGTTTLAEADRALLERYLAWLASEAIGHGARTDAITSVSAFLQAIRQHGWDATLPVTAAFFPGDIPSRPPQLTRHLAEHIMTQVESPANLDRWTSPEGRLITLILIRCGLRATDACTLAFDCLLRDGQGALPTCATSTTRCAARQPSPSMRNSRRGSAPSSSTSRTADQPGTRTCSSRSRPMPAASTRSPTTATAAC